MIRFERKSHLLSFKYISLYIFGETPLVYLGGAIVDAKSPNFTENLLNDRVAGHTRASHHLDATIGHSKQKA